MLQAVTAVQQCDVLWVWGHRGKRKQDTGSAGSLTSSWGAATHHGEFPDCMSILSAVLVTACSAQRAASPGSERLPCCSKKRYFDCQSKISEKCVLIENNTMGRKKIRFRMIPGRLIGFPLLYCEWPFVRLTYTVERQISFCGLGWDYLRTRYPGISLILSFAKSSQCS